MSRDNPLMGACGLDCEECDIRWASNDQELASTIAEWLRQNWSPQIKETGPGTGLLIAGYSSAVLTRRVWSSATSVMIFRAPDSRNGRRETNDTKRP